MQDPLVSVHMITYNHEPFIRKAIDCVLAQKTTFPFDLVIGEDCSTDGTREIVFDYAKRYPDIIRVITSEQNVGAKKNSKRTNQACLGKYIAFCEGDDYWHHPDKLQKQVAYMEIHPECGLIHSDYHRNNVKDGSLIKDFNKTMNNLPPENLNMTSILRGGRYLYILTCTVMARKCLINKVTHSDPALYQSNRFLLGDTSLWAEIANISKTHYINESLSTYNVLPISASKNLDPIKQQIFGKSVSEMCLYLVKKHKLSSSEYAYHLNKWCSNALPLAFYTRDKALAISAKQANKRLSIKNALFFYGTVNNFVYAILIYIINIKKKMLNKFAP